MQKGMKWGIGSVAGERAAPVQERDVLLAVPHITSHRQGSVPQTHQRLARTYCASLHCETCLPCLVVGF